MDEIDEFEDALETMMDVLVDLPEFSLHDEVEDELRLPPMLGNSADSQTGATVRQMPSKSPIGIADEGLGLTSSRRKLHSHLWGPRHILLRDKLSFLLGCTMLW